MSEVAATLQAIYDRLFAHFGHREWWPTETGAFEIIVGAYLVQNVAWTNAARAVANLREAGLLDPGALRTAPGAQVEACVRPAGYFRQKAARLQAFAAHLYARHGGDLQAMLAQPWPRLRAELLALPGVGPETADSILCYAAGCPVFVVDAYTRRILRRLGLAPTDRASYAGLQDWFHRHLAPDVFLYADLHAQLVALGNTTCLKRAPRCPECPLAALCARVGVEAG